MTLRRIALVGTILISLSTSPLWADSAEIAPPSFDGATTIVPDAKPYPDPSLAKRQVEEAFATAGKTHRRVLLVFGGNWCPDCRFLAGVFSQPDAATWLDAHFVVVPVNIGRLDKNLEIAAHYGVTVHEVPTILLVTPNGKLLNGDSANVLGDARDLSPQSVIDQIVEWNERD